MSVATDERDPGFVPATSAALSRALAAGPELPGESGRKREFLLPRIGQPGKHKWLFAAVWLVYLIGPLAEVTGSDRAPGWKVLNYVVTLLFVVIYCLISFMAFPRSGRIGTPQR